ncbi:MAG: HEAT repeat domain-containing protein, partial [Planctomycetota bacterium]
TLLMQFVGTPVGARVCKNCERIEAFGWLDPERRERVLDLPGPAQATAITLAAASNADRQQVADLIELLLGRGKPEGVVAAGKAIEALPPTAAVLPLGLALTSDDAAVVAHAASLLRVKDVPEATEALIALLDHGDARVRAAAQRGLRELSYTAFRDNREKMPSDVQRRIGQLVAKADPLVVPSLAAELNAAAVSRRLAALDLIDVMGVTEEVVDKLTRCLLEDADVGVRVEVATLLGRISPLPTVLEALEEATEDRSRPVREAVARSLQQLGTGPQLAVETV